MPVKKRSVAIRENISSLMLDQQQLQTSGTDEQMDNLEQRIEQLRSKLKLVEQEEKESHNDDED